MRPLFHAITHTLAISTSTSDGRLQSNQLLPSLITGNFNVLNISTRKHHILSPGPSVPCPAHHVPKAPKLPRTLADGKHDQGKWPVQECHVAVSKWSMWTSRTPLYSSIRPSADSHNAAVCPKKPVGDGLSGSGQGRQEAAPLVRRWVEQ